MQPITAACIIAIILLKHPYNYNDISNIFYSEGFVDLSHNYLGTILPGQIKGNISRTEKNNP